MCTLSIHHPGCFGEGREILFDWEKLQRWLELSPLHLHPQDRLEEIRWISSPNPMQHSVELWLMLSVRTKPLLPWLYIEGKYHFLTFLDLNILQITRKEELAMDWMFCFIIIILYSSSCFVHLMKKISSNIKRDIGDKRETRFFLVFVIEQLSVEQLNKQMLEENSIERCWTRLTINVNKDKQQMSGRNRGREEVSYRCIIALPDGRQRSNRIQVRIEVSTNKWEMSIEEDESFQCTVDTITRRTAADHPEETRQCRRALVIDGIKSTPRSNHLWSLFYHGNRLDPTQWRWELCRSEHIHRSILFGHSAENTSSDQMVESPIDFDGASITGSWLFQFISTWHFHSSRRTLPTSQWWVNADPLCFSIERRFFLSPHHPCQIEQQGRLNQTESDVEIDGLFRMSVERIIVLRFDRRVNEHCHQTRQSGGLTAVLFWFRWIISPSTIERSNLDTISQWQNWRFPWICNGDARRSAPVHLSDVHSYSMFEILPSCPSNMPLCSFCYSTVDVLFNVSGITHQRFFIWRLSLSARWSIQSTSHSYRSCRFYFVS